MAAGFGWGGWGRAETNCTAADSTPPSREFLGGFQKICGPLPGLGRVLFGSRPAASPASSPEPTLFLTSGPSAKRQPRRSRKQPGTHTALFHLRVPFRSRCCGGVLRAGEHSDTLSFSHPGGRGRLPPPGGCRLQAAPLAARVQRWLLPFAALHLSRPALRKAGTHGRCNCSISRSGSRCAATQ